LLTVELRNPLKATEGMAEVEIYCDSSGLSELSRQIQFLLANETHVHLMTPAWAGQELTEISQGVGTTLVHHLRISLVKQA
jgi:Immunity protein 32